MGRRLDPRPCFGNELQIMASVTVQRATAEAWLAAPDLQADLRVQVTKALKTPGNTIRMDLSILPKPSERALRALCSVNSGKCSFDDGRLPQAHSPFPEIGRVAPAPPRAYPEFAKELEALEADPQAMSMSCGGLKDRIETELLKIQDYSGKGAVSPAEAELGQLKARALLMEKRAAIRELNQEAGDALAAPADQRMRFRPLSDMRNNAFQLVRFCEENLANIDGEQAGALDPAFRTLARTQLQAMGKQAQELLDRLDARPQ
jgi:hypothetical protein